MRKFLEKQPHYIADYDYPVGMDTRPTITFGVADRIFNGRTSCYKTFSFRRDNIWLFFRQFKKWRVGHDNH